MKTPFQRSAEHPLGANLLVRQLAKPVLGAPVRGWVLYDGDCRRCRAAAARFEVSLRRHGFQFAPLQTPWVRAQLGLPPEAPLEEVKLLAADGSVFGGAAAIVQIARAIWWLWPRYALAPIPGVMILLGALYRRVAANRKGVSGVGEVKARRRHQAATTFFEMP